MVISSLCVSFSSPSKVRYHLPRVLIAPTHFSDRKSSSAFGVFSKSTHWATHSRKRTPASLSCEDKIAPVGIIFFSSTRVASLQSPASLPKLGIPCSMHVDTDNNKSASTTQHITSSLITHRCRAKCIVLVFVFFAIWSNAVSLLLRTVSAPTLLTLSFSITSRNALIPPSLMNVDTAKGQPLVRDDNASRAFTRQSSVATAASFASCSSSTFPSRSNGGAFPPTPNTS
mmetsp:Transcript_2628/g.9231  ORF Transcript_2628/g.9231 Transcript_2628/m.9231 type:complete len:229 (-) Transcript_2628:731-1417(-)